MNFENHVTDIIRAILLSISFIESRIKFLRSNNNARYNWFWRGWLVSNKTAWNIFKGTGLSKDCALAEDKIVMFTEQTKRNEEEAEIDFKFFAQFKKLEGKEEVPKIIFYFAWRKNYK